MDIDARKQRLDEVADRAGRDRVAWYGDCADTCPRCRVQVPTGYQLALPGTDVSGCLRCLEMQAHLFYGGLDDLPEDLAGVGGQQDALRLVAQEFRQHIKAAERGRETPSRRQSSSRWAAHSGWEATDGWEPPPGRGKAASAGESASERWPKRPMRAAPAPSAKRTKIRPQRRASAPRQQSPADILGLCGTPSRAEVIAAFRRSALVCHPDYGGSAEAFRELVEARDALLAEQ